jgi:hypothetical protein
VTRLPDWFALLALGGLIAAPVSAFDPWTDEARYEFVDRVDVGAIDVGEGQRVSLWILLAAENQDQQILHSAADRNDADVSLR